MFSNQVNRMLQLNKWHSLCCSRPVPLSLAETWTMPLASMSNVTSIWGTPRGAGGIPTRVNWPNTLLSDAISLSPWHTLISTWVCPSAAVENTCSGAVRNFRTLYFIFGINICPEWFNHMRTALYKSVHNWHQYALTCFLSDGIVTDSSMYTCILHERAITHEAAG